MHRCRFAGHRLGGTDGRRRTSPAATSVATRHLLTSGQMPRGGSPELGSAALPPGAPVLNRDEAPLEVLQQLIDALSEIRDLRRAESHPT